jgi:hypothetical protein
MDDDLARSGLVPSDVDATPYPGNGFTPDTGYLIPYYYPNGTPHPLMRRWRFTPALAGQRYGQPSIKDLMDAGFPATDATMPYLNPKILGGITWEQLGQWNGPVTWLLTEGEKKATCGGKELRKPVIGIGGCNNALVNTAMPWRDLHPMLLTLFRPGDTVEICFDGDINTNESVNYAAGTLRRVLLGRGIRPLFVMLPGQLGLDDWLMAIPQAARQAQYALLPRVDGKGFLEHPSTLARVLGMRFDEKGFPRVDEDNVQRLLRKHERYEGRIWFDCVKNRIYERIDDDVKPITDEMAFNEGVWMQRIFKVRPQMVQNVIMAVPSQPDFRRNPIVEWLQSLRWDGTARVEKMLSAGWGVEDTPYHSVIAKNLLTSMVARVMQPGCQVDTMTIFEGKQGIYKSKALEVLGGPWYVAASDKMDTKDFKVTCHTGWIIDIVELGSFKYADFAAIKGVITGRTDSFRPPYGRSTSEYKRHFVLVGTTNDDAYLRDVTGNRRFVPINCGNNKIDIEWIAANREQLFAEAYALYASGYEWWTEPPGILQAQAMRMTYDPWDGHLDAVLTDVMKQPVIGKVKPMYFVPTVNLLTMLGISRAQQNNGHYHRLRDLMSTRRDWERYQYNDADVPVGLADGDGGFTMVTQARGYRRIAIPPLPSATVIDIRNAPGTPGSKF